MHSPEAAATPTSLGPPSPATVTAWLTGRIAEYREIPASDVDPELPLAELGLDSVYVLSLCGDIEDRFGLEVEPTIAWDYPTVDALAAHLCAELAPHGQDRG
jgi:acyl carrier protein